MIKKKSKKHFLLLTVVFMICILLISCSPKKCGGIYTVPQESKDFGYFLKGSYWIYQNDSTQQLDSFFVATDTTFWTYSSDLSEGCNEETGPPGGTTFKYENFNSLAISNISQDSILYDCRSYGVYFFLNNRNLGEYMIPSYWGSEYVDANKWKVIDAIVINGKLYLDVYVSTWANDTLYFQKNIGVIKSQQQIDTTNYVESWSIVRYHSIQ